MQPKPKQKDEAKVKYGQKMQADRPQFWQSVGYFTRLFAVLAQEQEKQSQDQYSNIRTSFDTFFHDFIFFKGRVIQDFEFELIFGGKNKTKVQKDQLKTFYNENKKQDSDLPENAISLYFLLMWCQKHEDWPTHLWGDQINLPSDNPYDSKIKQLSQNTVELMKRMIELPELSNDMASAFRMYFSGNDEPNARNLENAMVSKMGINVTIQNDTQLIVEYFAIDQRKNDRFNIILFNQGLKALEKGKDLVNALNQYKTPQHVIRRVPEEVTDYSKDCTAYSRSKQFQHRPANFISLLDEYQVHDIIKGCFNEGCLVKDHFQKFSDRSSAGVSELSQQKFKAALSTLNVDWLLRSDEIYQNLQRQLGKIDPEKIDKHICQSAQTTLRHLHNLVLIRINEAKQNYVNFDKEFEKLIGRRTVCSIANFNAVLANCNVRLGQLDEDFVSKLYLTDIQSIDHNEFLKDVNNAQNLKERKILMQRLLSADEKILVAAKKVCFIKETTFQSMLLKIQNKQLNVNDFITLYSDKNTFNLFAYNICMQHELVNLYEKIKGAEYKSVAREDVEQQYKNMVYDHTDEKIKTELLQKIYKHEYREERFTVFNQQFSQLTEKIQKMRKEKQLDAKIREVENDKVLKFKSMLQQLEIEKIDQDYLFKLYERDLFKIIQDVEIGSISIQPRQNSDYPKEVTQKVIESIKKFSDPDIPQNTGNKDSIQPSMPLLAFFLKEQANDTEYVSVEGVQQAIQALFRIKSPKNVFEKANAQILCDLANKNPINSNEYYWPHIILLIEQGNEQKTAQIICDSRFIKHRVSSIENKQPTLQKQMTVLGPQARDQAHKFILQIQKELRDKNKIREVQDELNSKANEKNLNSVSPAAFKSTLEKYLSKELKDKINDVQGQNKASSKEERDKIMQANWKNLVLYLQREDIKCVSVKKFEEAMKLRDYDDPLQYEKIDYGQKREQLNQQLTLETVRQLYDFIKERNFDTLQKFLSLTNNQMITMDKEEFKNRLSDKKFVAKNIEELIQISIQDKKQPNILNLQKLENELSRFRPMKTVDLNKQDVSKVRQKFGNIDQDIRAKLNRISDFLQRNNITIEQFHRKLDTNDDGYLQKKEFVEGISKTLESGLFSQKDLDKMFDALDINQDGSLSVNEFALFIDGGKLKRDQQINQLDQTVKDAVHRKVKELFNSLAVNGKITADEIVMFYKFTNEPITLEQAIQRVKQVDKNKNGQIDENEFFDLVKDILYSELLDDDREIEDLRNQFKDADLDHSGFLCIDELYTHFARQGIDISRDEFIDLFIDLDVSQDRQIDIDEFCHMFQNAQNTKLSKPTNKETLLKIIEAKNLSKFDFLKEFSSIPKSYSPSFFAQKYNQCRQNLPSSVFRVQIDPRTLQWKDLLQIDEKSLTNIKLPQKDECKPKMQPIQPNNYSGLIEFDSVDNLLPTPPEYAKKIFKRAIRVGVFDELKKELQFNSCYVNAVESGSTKWVFKTKSEKDNLNPILFKTTEHDQLNPKHTKLVFELVLYVKDESKNSRQHNQCKELSCGWGSISIDAFQKEQKIPVQLQGGSPFSEFRLVEENQKKTGGIFAAKGGNPTITLRTSPLSKQTEEFKLHTSLLPSTCLISKKMVQMASAYRNYCAQTLLPQSMQVPKKPEADIVIKYFPIILDCPDALESIAQIWAEDVTKAQTKEVNFSALVRECETFMKKVFSVFAAVGFDYRKSNATMSKCCEEGKVAFRDSLIQSALRSGNPKYKKVQVTEALDTFKPFNIAELHYEAFDEVENKMDQMFKHFSNNGLYENNFKATNRNNNINQVGGGGAPSPQKPAVNQPPKANNNTAQNFSVPKPK